MTGLLPVLLLAAVGEGTVVTEPKPPPPPSFPKLGLQLDAGLPDGIGASLVFRPVRLLNLSAGAVTTGVSAGARVGVHLMPFGGFLRPTVGVEVGHIFEGQVPWVLNIAGAERYTSLAQRVSYSFANAQVGLEVGTRKFAVFARAGLGQVHARLSEFDAGRWDTGGNVDVRGLNLRFRGPSVKLGVVVIL